jgi:hypothetical protein
LAGIESLAAFVASLRDSGNVDRLLMAYTNSTSLLANEKYFAFKQCLALPLTPPPSERTVQYRKSRGSNYLGTETFVGEVLCLKGA